MEIQIKNKNDLILKFKIYKYIPICTVWKDIQYKRKASKE